MAAGVRPEVLQTLVDHHRRFLAFLEPRVGSRATAEELLQTAFVKTLERGGDIREGESAVAWFYRLLRNALVDFYRRRNTERLTLERHAIDLDVSPGDAAALEDSVCRCVYELIPTLKAEYAEVLKWVEMDSRSLADLAADLRITPGNAAVRLHRARQALKQRLEVVCGTCAEHACLDCTCRKRPS
jgi:RNA polymerase sigma factor (sigma-70 family)